MAGPLNHEQSERLKIWLETLRSDKYKQVKSNLKGEREDGGTGFCCLGVLCDLNGVPLIGEEEHDGVMVEITDGSAINPAKFQELVGLEGLDHDWTYEDDDWETGAPGLHGHSVEGTFPGTEAARLAELNDGGATFVEIADEIEEIADAIDPEWRTR